MKIIAKYMYWILMLSCVILFPAQAQTGISGYVNIDKTGLWESKIHLSAVHLTKDTSIRNSAVIASTTIDPTGYFSFDPSLLSENDQIYKLHVNATATRDGKNHVEKVKNFKLFIISKYDSIYFLKGKNLFNEYITNSTAHKEWKKLRDFESNYDTLTNINDTEEYLLRTKGFVKDSLQILLVKLISIKKLDTKNLLTKDIKANTPYYAELLAELKSRELDPHLFSFLETELLTVHGNVVTSKYRWSLFINSIGLALLIILGIIIYQIRKKKNTLIIPTLSKQETIIKNLIISGKSNKEIAETLFISVSTVKTHISNIYGKLHIKNRQELIKQ